jgi:hypothetical protein
MVVAFEGPVRSGHVVDEILVMWYSLSGSSGESAHRNTCTLHVTKTVLFRMSVPLIGVGHVLTIGGGCTTTTVERWRRCNGLP